MKTRISQDDINVSKNSDIAADAAADAAAADAAVYAAAADAAVYAAYTAADFIEKTYTKEEVINLLTTAYIYVKEGINYCEYNKWVKTI